ncbi:transition state regulator [Bacillus cereus]|uniref:transition state regulator n=1 Tax=Bacillus cereus TaxID=1396 RepID=UPI002117BB5F|nr:transition state regulator [Bacillus cereus]
MSSSIEIFVEGEKIILEKYQGYDACLISGEASTQNIKLADGKLTLGPEGVKQILGELEQYLEKL